MPMKAVSDCFRMYAGNSRLQAPSATATPYALAAYEIHTPSPPPKIAGHRRVGRWSPYRRVLKPTST